MSGLPGQFTQSLEGRYTLTRRLAVGGMAEIYLARQAAMAGFEKEVVIKRLRQELADDPRIIEMFLDEAKIGAQLNHPNIVHVYDVDEHDGIPYIAMEYIIGEELNELCRRGITHDRFLPIEHAVELMRQAKGHGADLVVYPEAALTAFFPHWWIDDEAEIDSHFETAMPSNETAPLFEESKRLGVGWSSNGDFLTPALHLGREVKPSRGPTITAAVDLLDERDRVRARRVRSSAVNVSTGPRLVVTSGSDPIGEATRLS